MGQPDETLPVAAETFRKHGLETVNSEALLVAAGQNLKRLLGWRGTDAPSRAEPPGIALPTLAPRRAVVF